MLPLESQFSRQGEETTLDMAHFKITIEWDGRGILSKKMDIMTVRSVVST